MKVSYYPYCRSGSYHYLGYQCYNGLVSMDENVSSQWANVETQYQRRADLIPNLVNTVKGYASHEKETLEGVVELVVKLPRSK